MKPQVLILMAGSGSRFRIQGIETPKPVIKFAGVSLWKIAASSVLAHAPGAKLFAATLDEQTTNEVAQSEWQIQIAKRSSLSTGPAHTVFDLIQDLDENFTDDQPLIVVDCDLWIDAPKYFQKLASLIKETQTREFILIPTFPSVHPQHSYVEYDANSLTVSRVAEKNRISSNAIAGVYCFSSPSLFKKLYELSCQENETREKFLSTLIQKAISTKVAVYASPTEHHFSFGTPEEIAKINQDDLPVHFPANLENFEHLMMEKLHGI